VYGQLPLRQKIVDQCIEEHGVDIQNLDAVVGRGGALAPVPSGAFVVDDAMLSRIREGKVLVEHSSMLGAPLAKALADRAGCPAYIVDPVCVDEYLPESRLSGLPEVPRRSLTHALSVRAAAYEIAKSLGRDLHELDLVVAHLGSGFTIACLQHGRQIDSNDATASGPMAPTRAGTLPALDFARLCLSGKVTMGQMEKKLVAQSGWAAHLGTDDIREIYRRIDEGDAHARLVLDATLLQVSKELGACFASMRGKVDAIVLTGGVCRSDRFVTELKERIAWLETLVYVLPGENEMLALARGASRVLAGQMEARSVAPYLT
jgi:butyrate kinase